MLHVWKPENILSFMTGFRHQGRISWVWADGIIYIFLFEIVPGRPEVDPWVWVIVGDVPPTYLTCEDAKTPYEALDGYIGAMEEWVEAARRGDPVADLIPVDVPASPANAEMWVAVSSSLMRMCFRYDSFATMARIAFLLTLAAVLLLALSPVRFLQELDMGFTFHHDKLNHAAAFAALAALGSLG
ncbi:hypothetical protein [Mesorhizobium sp. M0220]